MRERLIHSDVLECVLGLGPGLFYNSPMEACVVICRASKASERQGRVLFINAVDQISRQRSQSFLNQHHIERILGAYQSFAEVEGFAGIATAEEILANESSLSIPLYVGVAQTAEIADQTSLEEAIAAWDIQGRRTHREIENLMAAMRGAAK